MWNLSIKSISINPNGHVYAGTINHGIFRSNDNGESWSHIGLDNYVILSIGFNSSNHVFAGTGADGLFRSTDDGNSWTQIYPGYYHVLSIAINTDNLIFAAVFYTGVIRSTDNGDSWNEVNNGLTDDRVYTICINNDGRIFCGTERNGVFSSDNNGDEWTELNSGLFSMDVRCLALNPSDRLFAGTYGDGVFRSTQVTHADEPEEPLPAKFILKQNYPNPFNTKTNIGYVLPEQSDVRLDVYNLKGQKVEKLINSGEDAGYHSVQWDASGYSSGLYFYKLTAGNVSLTKRMVLLK